MDHLIKMSHRKRKLVLSQMRYTCALGRVIHYGDIPAIIRVDNSPRTAPVLIHGFAAEYYKQDKTGHPYQSAYDNSSERTCTTTKIHSISFYFFRNFKSTTIYCINHTHLHGSPLRLVWIANMKLCWHFALKCKRLHVYTFNNNAYCV